MSKYVRETVAGKQLSVYVVMKGGKEVATVLVHHTQSRCLVNVFQRDHAAARSAAKWGKSKPDVSEFCFQHASAGGYGYDKFTAALAGMWIDGHLLTDHCAGHRKPSKSKETFPLDAKAPRGWHFSNMVAIDNKDHTKGFKGYLDMYRESGLKYLEAIGYQVLNPL